MCKNSFFGNILELYIVASFSGECVYENDICKFKLKEQLKNNLSQLFNDTLNIQFVDGQFTIVNVKLCTLTEAIGKKVTNSEESQLGVVTLMFLRSY